MTAMNWLSTIAIVALCASFGEATITVTLQPDADGSSYPLPHTFTGNISAASETQTTKLNYTMVVSGGAAEVTLSTCGSDVRDTIVTTYMRTSSTSDWTTLDTCDDCGASNCPNPSANVYKAVLVAEYPPGTYHVEIKGYNAENIGEITLDASVTTTPNVSTVCREANGIRLTGESCSQSMGRIEVFHAGRWGTVCDDYFGVTNAGVICQEFGFSGGTFLSSNNRTFGASYPDPGPPIWADNVRCTGNEPRFTNCLVSGRFNGFGIHNCHHGEDAGVSCVDTPGPADQGFLSCGDAVSGNTLTGSSGVGNSAREHNFTIHISADNASSVTFSTCDSSFDTFLRLYNATGLVAQNDDSQTCGLQAVLNVTLTPGDYVLTVEGYSNRNGRYELTMNCGSGVNNTSPSLPVRLVNGSNEFEGRVEVYSEQRGAWGTVCDDRFGDSEANIICGMLGFGTGTVPMCGLRPCLHPFGSGNSSQSILLDDLSCTGTENSIFDCSHLPVGTHNCVHAEDAGVRCQGATPPTPPPTAGGVRLVDSDFPGRGRVEVQLNNSWGTVCDDYWSTQDAEVVCRQLGLSGGVAYSRAYFGQGTLPIKMDNVRCVGNESSIFDCPYVSNHNCQHSEDASVECATIRLLDPSTGNVSDTGGIVQVAQRANIRSQSHTWWTVRGDSAFDSAAASAVCRMLGHTSGTSSSISPPAGSVTLWSQTTCSGVESNLYDCVTNQTLPSGATQCAREHSNSGCQCTGTVYYGSTTRPNAWVSKAANSNGTTPCNNAEFDDPMYGVPKVCYCDTTSHVVATVSCSDATTSSGIRLLDGPSIYEGRVEVYRSGQWGTICDDGWTNQDAKVVCRALGASGGVAFSRAAFGEGEGPILVGNVNCSGSEANLDACHPNWGTHSFCTHREDAGVRCNTVRLANGASSMEGRVEVLGSDNLWHDICPRGFGTVEAQLVCAELGLAGGRVRNNFGVMPSGGGATWTNVGCTGSESSIMFCNHSSQICSNRNMAGVVCDQSIRLAGGTSPLEGRVEIYANGQYGTVCDDYWDDRDAAVVCRQLGFAGGIARSRAAFGQGAESLPILLDDMTCDGSEETLLECGSAGLGSHNCRHSEDAGVICTNLRLTSQSNLSDVGADRISGIVETFADGAWTPVCGNLWGAQEANVVCGQLGLGNGTSSRVAARDVAGCVNDYDLISTGSMPGQVPYADFTSCNALLSNCTTNSDLQRHCRQTCGTCAGSTAYRCSGSESMISSCTHRSSPVVSCQNYGAVTCDISDNIRLAGNNATAGRVEVFYNGEWGTVCDDGWTNQDAQVVCRQLGLTGGVGLPRAAFGQGSGQISLDDVRCTGNESNIFLCPVNRNHNCHHSEDASAVCSCPPNSANPLCNVPPTPPPVPQPTPGPGGPIYRLMNGNTDNTINHAGRLEIFHNGTWGTVCMSGFDTRAANLVCQALANATGGNTAYTLGRRVSTTPYGLGSNSIPVWLSNINCHGGESSLDQCSRVPWRPVCSHTLDVSIRCSTGNPTPPPTTPPPPPGGVTVRLVGGSGPNSGRVEFYNGSTWGTVCDDAFGFNDAKVVCRELGYSNGYVRPYAQFGEGTLPIVLDDVECRGNETSLSQCVAEHNHNCRHVEDVGVVCRSAVLVNGRSGSDYVWQNESGRVSIHKDNRYGSVCSDGFGAQEAEVVCRELGLGSGRVDISFGTAPVGAPIFFSGLGCRGDEQTLESCDMIAVNATARGCRHNSAGDPGVVCEPGVRLAGFNATSYQGRVEVYTNGVWGTVCDDYWNDVDANIVCRQLGFPGGRAIERAQIFGPAESSVPILLDNVRCDGGEQSLLQCSALVGDHNCEHLEDAGVICDTTGVETTQPPFDTVQLISSSGDPSYGELQGFFYNRFQSVCMTGINTGVATVACQQLGYAGGELDGQTSASAGEPTVSLHCGGTESSLQGCQVTQLRSCTNVAIINCTGVPPPPPPIIGDLGALHLVQNTTAAGFMTGLLTIDYPSGTGAGHTHRVSEICSSGFTAEDANVACKQMGFHSGAVVPRPAGALPNYPTLMYDVDCNELEPRLIACPHQSNDGTRTCSAGPVFVQCKSPIDFDVRLISNGLPSSSDDVTGVVEFYSHDTEGNGGWGTVCDDGLAGTAGTNFARTVCGQLGFIDGQFKQDSESQYASLFTGPLALDNVRCSRTAGTLGDCAHNNVGQHDCSALQKVVISCKHGTGQISSTLSPIPEPAGGNSGSAGIVIGISIVCVLLVAAAVVIFFRMRKKGGTSLAATYQQVVNDGFDDADDADDDDLIIPDVDQQVGGSMALDVEPDVENPYATTGASNDDDGDLLN